MPTEPASPREPTGTARAEIVVKRSRFIAAATAVTSVDAAETELRRVRDEHPDANHVVYAYLVGDERSEQAGLSDAGEPKGTAGRPVMEILRGSGVRDVLLTVVRYFGGTKLGTGGLVHAYGDAARAVLERLPTRQRIDRLTARCSVPYDLLERTRQFIDAAGGTIADEQYGTSVAVVWEMPSAHLAALREQIQDLSRGVVEIETE
ncbi:MAG: IMPACT family protein [Spirochaetota bacterium]